MNYTTAVDYINSFINFEKIPKYQYSASFKPDRMTAILEELGNPHKDLRIIHVAGSKGKGSTCAMAAYILKEAGYKVGLYTSPHLVDFRERIRILEGKNRPEDFEGMIGKEELCEVVDAIKPVAERFRDHKKFGKISFFEILTACAFLYFKKKQVDIVVLETGLGGRLDATNAAMPLVCGITNISLEHTDKLGDTLGKIAYEKAGIIKRQGTGDRGQGTEVVTARQEKEAADVIRKTCRERDAKLHEVGKDIKYSIVSSDENKQVFELYGPGYSYKDLNMGLLGIHQVENACVAIGIIKAINNKFNIAEGSIRKGLRKAVWPGRMQIIQRDPCMVLDGAQNPASISALISSIKKIFRYNRLICIFGISSDKDIKGVSRILGKFSDIIVLTMAKGNPRATDISTLRGYFSESRAGLEGSSDVIQAIDKAIKFANKDDLILITGSLFVVGDAIKFLQYKGDTFVNDRSVALELLS